MAVQAKPDKPVWWGAAVEQPGGRDGVSGSAVIWTRLEQLMKMLLQCTAAAELGQESINILFVSKQKSRFITVRL